ncbi:N-acetylmuramoyl-L-alanine amidase [Dysgonomonas sp. ZJ709]|uniref:N-acetylmuramoyl-L-alanine amidase family protein n=1 Tax=Dysgonomonas sp. ZJ709 TaxID=2709797 RepID=UPI0013EDB95A|nr:N-acetylmuramoyl-L-alanine amidase [Dysgonomonas sp. ZJ709]
MKIILSLFICLLTFCGVVSAADNKFVVVIDAGHGGKDGGAVRASYKEKSINLGVALALGQLIEKNYKDVKVVYTRKSDVFVDLDRRAEIANKAKANLFISIHTNSTAAKTTSASGADTYILGLARSEENLEVAKRENSVILLEDDYTTKYEGFDPNSPESNIIFEFMTNKYMEQSLQFASFVQSDFKNVAKRNDRGVRQAGFLVLRKTSTPSVLIELGFINNIEESRYLASSVGQKNMATAIYSGFKKYKRNFDKMQGNQKITSSNDNDDDVIVVDEIDIVEESPIVVASARESNANTSSSTKNNTQTKTATNKNNEIEYRVQFYVSPTKLASDAKALKGLSPVDYYRDGSSYKYTYGATTDYNEVLKLQRQVRTKFKDAFVIKFRNGERLK